MVDDARLCVSNDGFKTWDDSCDSSQWRIDVSMQNDDEWYGGWKVSVADGSMGKV
jgi:hypothetical protein